MSETLTLTGFRVNEGKLASCGKLVTNASGKVVDQTGKPLGPKCLGELCFKRESIMKGYLGDPVSTSLVLDKDGWFSTGDVGYYDENGYFYIVDRVKELIKYKSYQVAPAELEGVLLTHPSIADVAVIGIPHERNDELPRAFVVVKKDKSITEDEVKNYVVGKLSPEKWLRGGVEFVSEIPKSSTGKVLRKTLKEQYKLKSKL